VSTEDSNLNGAHLIRQYADLGWKLLRLHPETKQPVGKAWQERDGLTADYAIALLGREIPLGVQVGKVSHWLCSVDCDSSEAKTLAPIFLPETLTKGRLGLPSNYVYISEGLNYQGHKDLDMTEILCIKAAARGQGHQIVLPPSRHPDGSFYEWTPHEFDPNRIAKVEADDLARRARYLATASLIAAYLKAKGRHEYSLALAGHLLRQGVEKSVVITLLRAAWTCTGAPPKALSDLVINVNSTDEKIQRGEPATSTTRLNELVEGLPRGLDRCLDLRTYQAGGNTTSSPGSWDDAGPIKVLSDAITNKDHFARDLGDRLYRFSDGCYRQYAERYIRRKVKKYLEWWGKTKKWSAHLANEVCEYILADAPELWERPPLDEVNLANGILNLDTGDLREHDPRFLSPVQIPVVFDPTAECPAWDKFVSEVFPEDARELAFELAADLMTPTRSAQQAVLFLGEGSNGKSTYLRALTSFIGSPNASGVSLHKLESDKFATSRLLRRLANICPDLPSTHLAETSVFKAITGGDAMHGEYKYKASFEFRPFCRLIFSANHVPRSSDASHAFFRRWVVVPFDRTFEPDEQIPRETLDATLSTPHELSGVLNKALEVLPRVRFQGFTQSQSMREAWEEFKATTDPVSVWLENHTIDDARAWVPKSVLIRAFNKSAEDSGQATLTKQAFGRAMRRARPHVGEAQRTVGDKQVKCYTGIGLKSGDDPDDPDDGGNDSPGPSHTTAATTNTTDYTIVTYPEVKKSDSKEQIHRNNKYGNGSNDSKGSSVEQTTHKYVTTDDSVAEVTSYLDALPTNTLIGLDLETTGLDPRHDEIRLAQIYAGDKTFVIDLFEVSDDRTVFEALERPPVVVAHNAAFEYGFVLAKYGIALDNIRDTYLLARLVAAGDMRVECGLAAVVERELGITLDKEPQTSDWSGRLTSRQLEYAARDAHILPPLYESLTKKVAESGQQLIAEIEHAALPAVARMGLEGLPVDRRGWDEYAADVARRRDGLAQWMCDADWMPKKDPTPQQWALQGPDCLAMLHAAGVEAKGSTAKQLEPFTDNEIVAALLSYRKAKGEAKDKARALVHQLAPPKPPMEAPPWNFSSNQQVLEIASRILGFKLPDTSEATLLRYVDKHRFFRAQLRYRKLSKQASTYGSEWFKDAYDYQTGRLYPRWHQIGTSTGRFSCSSPNVQNIPLEGPYRSFFRAPKGRVFVDVDYSQIEVRIYAKMVGEKALLDAFERGGDVYRATAARLMRVPPSKVTKTQRQKAKAIMLGLLYGLSARGLPHYAFTNYGVEIPPKEAKDLISRFFRLYPNISDDHDKAAQQLDEKGSVDRVTLSRRRRDRITVRNEAINAPIQGTAADGLKAAMGRVFEGLRDVEGAFIVGAFHDELLIECNEHHGEEVKAIVEKVMIEAMDAILNSTTPHVAITVDGAVVPAWTED
jgi:P4 family phage/plasmid primase-like protien